MPSKQECQQLKEDLDSLSSLGEESDRLLKVALESGKEEDISRLEELKKEVMERKEGFKDKLWPFPELPRIELEAQYRAQIEILERTGLLVRLANQELGIKTQAQEYPLPTFQEIARRLRDPSFAAYSAEASASATKAGKAMEGKEKREILKNKISQGFNQIQITPLLPINTLKQTLSRLLLEHHNNHKLFKTKRKPPDFLSENRGSSIGKANRDNDPDEALDLDVSNPTHVYDGFRDNPELKYYPKALDPDNHQGLTKDQLIQETKGFNIILTENDQFLPQENDPQNLPLNGRKRIENNKTPIEYLGLIDQTQYQGESYLIIEDWLTQFITHLEQTNQVINDWNDHNATWLLGNYLPPTKEERQQNPGSSGKLPFGCWFRGVRWAKVDWVNPDSRNSEWGVRPAVRI